MEIRSSPDEFRLMVQNAGYVEYLVQDYYNHQNGHINLFARPCGKHIGADFGIIRVNNYKIQNDGNVACSGLIEKHEVKYDAMSKQTKNLFFEIRNSRQNKDSGLKATRAAIWDHVVWHDNRWTLITYNPQIMLRELETGHAFLDKYTLKTSVGDNNSDGYLASIEQVLKLNFVTVEIGFRVVL